MSWLAWIWNNIAPDVRVRRGLAGPRTGEEARAEWARIRESRPAAPARCQALDEFRDVAPYLFEWLRHPAGDPWWDWAELRGRYGRVGAAVLNLSGWHDEAYGPEGALTNFLGLRGRAARPGGRADEAAPRPLGARRADGQRRGAVALRRPRVRPRGAPSTTTRLILRFMDRYVRGLDNGVDREPAVRAFVMGENAWREADRWPLPGTRPADARPRRRSRCPGAGTPGLARSRRDANGSDSFVSDPARPVSDPYAAESGAHDYRQLRRARGRRRVRDGAARGRPAGRGADHGRDLRLDRAREGRRHLGQALRRRAGRHGLQPDEPRPRRRARELPRAAARDASCCGPAASTRCASRT